MAKEYFVRFKFIIDEKNSVPCECVVEADNFVQAQFKACEVMAKSLSIYSITEVDE